ncbi:hypothetical protein WA026_011637 [Henosepilachna vigintioctopunctata]|uniref:Uncharacterized protein n=1 Tax=Henosepilachna vigintioctopunctata TaxID=420089 RepID=A0AAW1TTG0_9CUCU
MELVPNHQEEQKEEENWEFNKNIDRKESFASTISDVSTSSNESTSNEELKKEKRDTLPTLKLPNMDDKLRKKRKINRRQLKSLDSGVHHYYGEYIAIEFPINESDEVENKLEPEKDIKQSTVKETPEFISTNRESTRRYDGMNSIKPEDGHTSERGNVDFQL